MQFLTLTTRGQEVTASGWKTGPGGAEWVVGGGCSELGDPHLLTPDFGFAFSFVCLFLVVPVIGPRASYMKSKYSPPEPHSSPVPDFGIKHLYLWGGKMLFQS